jgi:hypothetical protein
LKAPADGHKSESKTFNPTRGKGSLYDAYYDLYKLSLMADRKIFEKMGEI